MQSSLVQRPDIMLTDDIFEGWLSLPASLLTELGPISDETVISQHREDQNLDGTAESLLSNKNHETHNQSPRPVVPHDGTPSDSAARKRRGHTKSRLGCIPCKKRKIKCQETWPSCANCLKRGCLCRYPTVFKHTQYERIVSEVMRNPPQSAPLSDTPTIFSANDMRLFHHFLLSAHPCIPHQFKTIWVRDVPLLSHRYEYLMHGMLALAGSHLSIFVDDSSGNSGLAHRQKAIVGLEGAFAKWPLNAEEAHVMLATSYVLATQSNYLPDALLDHILSLRGCALLSQIIHDNLLDGAFSAEPQTHTHSAEVILKNLPDLDQTIAREALHSLAAFSHLLPAAHEIERELVAQLASCVQPLLLPAPAPNTHPTPEITTPSTSAANSSPTSIPFTIPSPATIQHPLLSPSPPASFESINWNTITDVPPGTTPDPTRAFNALMSSLTILSTWPRTAILHLFAPENKLGHVVLAHFCAVRFVIAPFFAPDAASRVPIGAMVEWAERVVDAVGDGGEGDGWRAFVEWPRRVLGVIGAEVRRKRGLGFGKVRELLVREPEAFREGRG